MHDQHEAKAEMPCADGLATCMIEGDVNHDGRYGQLKSADGSAVAGIPFDHSAFGLTPNVGHNTVPRYTSIHPGAPPPIHLLNCVFLD